ncbi:MAG TPA: hypothetical protein VHT92_04425 [Candidatus Cybelea sp.]|nr:hypothetical protein [Candidatus Cybelea sp.]
MLVGCAGGPPSLPSVGEVQARFVTALGGRAAIMRPHSVTMRGTYEIYGPHGKRVRVATVLYLANFKRLDIQSVPGRGRYLSGYDGKIGWAIAPGEKPTILAGSQAVSLRRDADLYYWAHIPQYFRKIKVVGVESFAGHRCYHLRGTTLWGNENNQYYDVAGGLLAGYRFHQWVSDAPEKPETRQVFERYRSFGGLAFPTRETDFTDNRLVGVGRLDSVTYDDVNPRIFVPPATVLKRS